MPRSARAPRRSRGSFNQWTTEPLAPGGVRDIRGRDLAENIIREWGAVTPDDPASARPRGRKRGRR